MIWTDLKLPIAIVGMGSSGDAAFKLLIAGGVPKESLKTFDSSPGKADYSKDHDLLKEFSPKTLVVSPGVPLSTPWISGFKGDVTSEISLSVPVLTTEKIIGVTGSVGKSTTVSLLGAAVQSFSKTAFVGGNLGTPLAVYAAAVLTKSRAVADWLVLELSSYQLENCAGLNCDVSAITYFTPNHLERYPDIKAYYKSKSHLITLTKKKCFLNFASAELVSFFNTDKNSLISWSNPVDSSLDKYKLAEAALLGEHNLQNLALATHVALACDWPQSCVEAMKSFKGLSHRLENLGTINGVLYVNDSKATTIESVKTAVTSLKNKVFGNSKLFLLCGGKDKNLPWDQLAELKSEKNIEVLFFGDVSEKAKAMSNLDGTVYKSLKDCVLAAKAKVKSGDIVLLSPGGTSLDEFKNFEQRGDFFKELVLS